MSCAKCINTNNTINNTKVHQHHQHQSASTTPKCINTNNNTIIHHHSPQSTTTINNTINTINSLTTSSSFLHPPPSSTTIIHQQLSHPYHPPVAFLLSCFTNELSLNCKTNLWTKAESQWIVATKATLPLTIPRPNSSRLHAIHPYSLSFSHWTHRILRLPRLIQPYSQLL